MAKFIVRAIFLVLVSISWIEGCPDSFYWIEAGESCYRSLPDLEPQSWYDAKRFCKEANGYLLEIQSAEEMETIKKLFRHDWKFWTGGNNLMNEDEWTWYESNTPMEFSYWDVNEPHEGDDRCVATCGPEMEWCNQDCYSKEESDPIYALCEAPNS